MARLHTAGFETNTIAYECDDILNTPVTSATWARTGTYSCELGYNDEISYTISSAPTTVYVGFAFRFTAAISSTQVIWHCYGNLSTEIINVCVTGSTQTITIRRGTGVLATSASALSIDTDYYIEIYYYMDNSSGVVTVKVNGSQWVTYSGDTINGADTTIATARFRGPVNLSYVDDLVINDTTGSYNNTWPGQPKLLLATVNGAGTNTDLTPSAGSNYQCVDEIPITTGDYVYSTVATDVDTYDITDPLGGTETLNNVVVQAVAQLDSGSGSIDLVLISNTTTDNGTAHPLTEGWARYQTCWPLNPDDSAAWAPTDIDDLEIGVEIS